MRHQQFMRVFAAALLALSVSACSLLPTRPPVDNPEQIWQERNAEVADIERWNTRGRIGLHTPRKNGSASFVWSHHGPSNQIDIRGPLGSGHARLNTDEQGAELIDAKGDVYKGADAEALLFNTLEWNLPVSGLEYWIVGLPEPASDYQHDLDDQGRLSVLRQDGWTITYQGWADHSGRMMPRKIFLKTEVEDADLNKPASIDLRLVVQQWILN